MLRQALSLVALTALSHQAAVPRQVTGDDLPPLKFNDDGAFQIAIFSDLHFGEGWLSTTFN